MKSREGKEPFSFIGYTKICEYMMAMKPVFHKFTWNESIFSNLYLRLQFGIIIHIIIIY